MSRIHLILAGSLAALLLLMLYRDLAPEEVYGFDRLSRALRHLHLYVLIALSAMLLLRGVAVKKVAIGVIVVCVWCLGVIVADYRGLPEKLESYESRFAAQVHSRGFYRKATWNAAFALAIGSLAGLVVMQRKTAQPGATDNPDGAQPLREDH